MKENTSSFWKKKIKKISETDNRETENIVKGYRRYAITAKLTSTKGEPLPDVDVPFSRLHK